MVAEAAEQMKTEDAAKPWARLPGESSKAFAAFTVYLRLGPGRSLETAARRHYSGHDPAPDRPKKSAVPGGIKVWSVRFRWVERADAWDRHQEAIRTEATEKAERERAERWVNRRDELAEADWSDAEALRKQARLMILLPVITRRVVDAGTVTIIEPATPQTIRSAAAALKDASELGWKAVTAATGGGDPGAERSATETSVVTGAVLDEAGRDLDAWAAQKQAEIAAIPLSPPAEQPANGGTDG